MSQTPTACVLIVGNEILSGRTQDTNLNFLAARLGQAGIPLREARVVPDVASEIIAAVNACRARYTYVFTTGGIGPTHDDITAQCVADAFGVPLERNAEAMRRLEEYYSAQGTSVNEARARMANIPRGAALLDNPVSRAPGFQLGNVFVLPGVPRIMQAIFELVLPTLSGGPPVVMHSLTTALREGDLATPLAEIAAHYPQVDIGSYPNMRSGRFITQLVCKSTDASASARAHEDVARMIAALGGEILAD